MSRPAESFVPREVREMIREAGREWSASHLAKGAVALRIDGTYCTKFPTCSKPSPKSIRNAVACVAKFLRGLSHVSS